LERKFSRITQISQIKEKDQERFDAWLSCAGVLYWNLRGIEVTLHQIDVQGMIDD
jgi:hypothetical protein